MDWNIFSCIFARFAEEKDFTFSSSYVLKIMRWNLCQKINDEIIFMQIFFVEFILVFSCYSSLKKKLKLWFPSINSVNENLIITPLLNFLPKVLISSSSKTIYFILVLNIVPKLHSSENFSINCLHWLIFKAQKVHWVKPLSEKAVEIFKITTWLTNIHC